MVIVKDRQKGHRFHQEDLLDGIVPDHVIDLMSREVVRDDLKLCEICESEGARCHILLWIAPNTYAKYCPVLWHDVFKPTSWKVKDLI
jgi:hypothetical protein